MRRAGLEPAEPELEQTEAKTADNMSAGQSPVFRQPNDVKLGDHPTYAARPSHKFPVIRVYDVTGSVIEIHECAGDFKEW